ncbi:MAG: Lrp/AsnC family transcriptional regulator, partial [Sediminibacterium sp.]
MKNKAIIEDSAIANNTIPLDAKDLAILRLLQANARISVKEIAESVQLSTTPVHERIKRLESSGVIKQYAT